MTLPIWLNGERGIFTSRKDNRKKRRGLAKHFKFSDKLTETYLPPGHWQNSLPKIIAPHRLPNF